MTKAEIISKGKELLHSVLDRQMIDDFIKETIEFAESQPDIIHCKECSNFNPNLKYCTQWECTMYKNSYCDQGERKKDGQ